MTQGANLLLLSAALSCILPSTGLRLAYRPLRPWDRLAHCRCSATDDGDVLLRALRAEATRRGETFGKRDMLAKIGPHSTASPKQVVEHVVEELSSMGNISQAFRFTAMPPWKQGTHRSTTDWSQRMDWERCKVIHGTCSGGVVDMEAFEGVLRSKYAALLETKKYRFVGDDSAWQQKGGAEKMTAEKEYVVEVQTKKGEHLLLKFKLVYDWLMYCHLVAAVSVFSWDNERFFPGSGDLSECDI